ncbi:MAG: THUMP domain-containing protein [Actinomycetota bacterium]
MDVNLVVTYDPVHSDAAREAVEAVFNEIGIKSGFLDSEYGGIFLMNVQDPRQTVKELRKLCLEDKEIFSWTYHYIPVDMWVSSEIEDMQDAVKSVASGVGDSDKWKLDLAKRHYHRYQERELILKLTDMVETGEVDLERPEKIIKVEIIGKHAGISLLEPEELLMVSKI